MKGEKMRFLIQRVGSANVTVDNKTTGKIGKGFLVLVGVKDGDTKEIADYMIKKLVNMRIFEDENEKMNLALKDVDGELLVVSQFTLYADCTEGNRPSFTQAAKYETAQEMYEYIVAELRKKIKKVETGVFGAHMEVNLNNSGPVTIILEK